MNPRQTKVKNDNKTKINIRVETGSKTIVKYFRLEAIFLAAFFLAALMGGFASCSRNSGKPVQSVSSPDSVLQSGSKLIVRNATGTIVMARIQANYKCCRPEKIFSFSLENGTGEENAAVEVETFTYTLNGVLDSSRIQSWQAAHPELKTLRIRRYDVLDADSLPLQENATAVFSRHPPIALETQYRSGSSADGLKDTLFSRLTFPGTDTAYVQRQRTRFADGREEVNGLGLFPAEAKDPGSVTLVSRSLYQVNQYANGKLMKSVSTILMGSTQNENTVRYAYAGDKLDSLILDFPFGQTAKGKVAYQDLNIKAEIQKEFTGFKFDLTGF